MGVSAQAQSIRKHRFSHTPHPHSFPSGQSLAHRFLVGVEGQGEMRQWRWHKESGIPEELFSNYRSQLSSGTHHTKTS